MKMTNNKIRKKIKEIKSKLPSLKEEKIKLQNSIKSKREELLQIKSKFYSHFTQDETDNVTNKKDLEINHKLHDTIFSLYKSIIDKSKQKITIEFSLESINSQNHSDQRQLSNKINDLLHQSREIDDSITKVKKDIEKTIKSNSIQFEFEHYVINPAMNLVDHIAELDLAKQVQRKLERLLKHSENESEEINEEYNERKRELDDIRGKYHIDFPLTKNLFNNNTFNTNTNTITNEIKLSSKDLLNEVGDNRAKYESNIDFIDIQHENSPCEEEYDDNASLEVDTSVLNKKHLERFIESPRFIDKVSNNTIALINPLKPLRFDSIVDMEHIDVSGIPATLLKVKRVEKEKESLSIINSQLDEVNQSIKGFQKDYDMLLKHNKQLKKKYLKLKDNIAYANNRIEILSDQIELLSQETHIQNHNNNNDNKTQQFKEEDE